MGYREDLIVTLTVVEDQDQTTGDAPGNRSRVLGWLGTHKISAVLLAAFVAVLAMIALSPSAPAQAQSTAPATMAQPTAPAITEDSPAWDCRTMGNGLCGPGNANGATPGYYRGGKLYADWDHAQWLVYGLQVAGQAGPSVRPVAQTVSTPGDSPDNPLILQPLPRDAAPLPDADPAPAPAPTYAAPTAPQTRDLAAPQATPQTAPTDSQAAPSSGSIDPAVIAQLVQAAQGASSGDSVDTGQLAGLLSQLDPDTLKALLPLARQACQVIR
jgi:hypothetical protein